MSEEDNQNSEFLPVGTYRGAISKKDLENFEIEIDEDSFEDPTKKKKKRKKKLNKKEGSTNKKKKLTSSGTLTSSGNFLDLVDDDEPFVPSKSLLDITEEIPTKPTEIDPKILDVWRKLKQNENIAKLSSSRYNNEDFGSENFQRETDALVLMVNVKSTSDKLKFKVYKTDNFHKIVDSIANKYSVPRDEVVLKFDGIPISIDETPQTCLIQDNDVVEAILPIKPNEKEDDFEIKVKSPSQSGSNEDKVKFRIRIKGDEYMKVSLNRDDPIEKAFNHFCNKLKCDPKKIKFSFDGEKLNLKTTPNDLEMEDDDLIDSNFADFQ